jgi:transcriptional regulator with XRE-family HTH domain
MKTFICPTCNKGEVKDTARAGRRMHFRNIPDLEIPADIAIPTCTHPECGEEWIDGAVAARVDEAMKTAYQAALTTKAEEAISKLKKKAPQRDLERLLGLSAGYLSKLKHGKETTAPLVAALMLLASDPRRIDDLRTLWSVQPHPEPPSVTVLEISAGHRKVRSSLPLPTPGIVVKLKPANNDFEFFEPQILSANA